MVMSPLPKCNSRQQSQQHCRRLESGRLFRPQPKSLYRWIQTQYLDTAFNTVGFVGWKKFEAALAEQKLAQKGEIGPALQ
jgi:hypothetical protein